MVYLVSVRQNNWSIYYRSSRPMYQQYYNIISILKFKDLGLIIDCKLNVTAHWDIYNERLIWGFLWNKNLLNFFSSEMIIFFSKRFTKIEYLTKYSIIILCAWFFNKNICCVLCVYVFIKYVQKLLPLKSKDFLYNFFLVKGKFPSKLIFYTIKLMK